MPQSNSKSRSNPADTGLESSQGPVAALLDIFSEPLYPYATCRGISSVGRALAWHARGQGFKSPILHCRRPIVSGKEKIESRKIRDLEIFWGKKLL